jgi:hypothetical protein
MVSASAAVVALPFNGTGTTDWLFEDCLLVGAVILTCSGAATATRNFTFRRCEFLTYFAFNASISGAAATADADLAITFEHCRIFGRPTANIALAGSGGNLAGGVRWKYCDVYCMSSNAANGWQSTALRVSTVTPCRIEGCKFIGGIPVSAGTSGHFVDDGYNRFLNGSASSNFTLAGTSKEGFMPQLILSSLRKWGLTLPRMDSMGWWKDATTAQKFSGGSNTSSDFFGGQARPWGAGPSIGAIEYADMSQDTGSQITGGGANSLKLTGAGEVSLWIPVDAAATVVTVTTESASYGGSNWPQMILQANPSIGYAGETVTASSASEQTLAGASFTPTAAGVVELRLVSRSSSGSSSTYFDRLGRT